MLEKNLVDYYTLVYGHQFQLLCYYSELHGCSGQTERQCFELVCPTLDMKFDVSWTVPVLVYGSRRP